MDKIICTYIAAYTTGLSIEKGTENITVHLPKSVTTRLFLSPATS